MNKILVVTNGNIGDFIMASSALKLLRLSAPSAKITLIVSIKVKDFIENLSLADKIIYTDFSFAKSALLQRFDQIIWFFKNYFKLKKEKFDSCIFLDHSRFFAKAVVLLGIKNLIGPSTWWCGDNAANPNIKSLNYIVKLPINSDLTHLSYRYQTIIRNYFDSYNMSMPSLPQTSLDADKKAVKLLNKTKKYSIAFSFRGDNIKGNKKIYPSKYIIEIIKQTAKEFDADFYFLGTKDSFDEAQKIKEELSNLSINNLCAKTRLTDLQSIFKYLDLLICVDTGIIHIAATTAVKIIGLYGANLYNSIPMSHKAIVLGVKESCSPCHYSRTVLKIPCAYGDSPKCLSDIKPQAVICAIKKQLTVI
ncbi:MAG: glycosyltransferase family 9 protein [Elusimicrobiota bacterium]|jgi:heptosyltransferase-2|nr:glycosyltransferase family 9 protein [Elusimicrobiota bacterium]